MSRNDTYPQHVVTAVIVAHDGAPWLSRVCDAMLDQTRPVQRVVAVDTGSRDRSGGLLAGKLGNGVVFGMDRGTGYGTAVAKALQHKAANVAVPVPSSAGKSGRGPARGQDDRVEWIWLLHDDCEPAPDALEQLLRGAAETPQAAVLGPKVRDWSDRDVLLEAGVTIDTVGRRITGIEPREVDQGQHDGDRDTLAVGSAGMLIRRDVWDAVRGFDPSMGLFREDVDFCWRVHAAGFRVRVITDAVVFHAQAAARRRRSVSVGRRPQLLDRRNALLTLAGNLPLVPMVKSLAGNVCVSFLRVLFFLLAKRVTAALDESAALASVLLHPLRLAGIRRMRARGRKAAYGRLRNELPRGRSLRRIAEFAAAMFASDQQAAAGSHHATEDPDEADDFLLTDSGIVQRILTNPGVLLLLGLAVVTIAAERSLLSAGTLGGGALLPAGGAASVWHEYVLGFHPTGVGSPSVAPTYLAIVALLATLLTGKAWLAVDVILLGCVPIAGMTAYFAIRRVTASVVVRIWVAATYALIPVAAGAISAGRVGTAAAFALIPLIGLQVGRMFSQPPRMARRAAWATGLITGVAAAFVPLVWVIALLAGVAAAVALRAGRRLLINIGIAVIVPVVLLIPWVFQLAAHPSELLLEAGIQQTGLASPHLATKSLMLMSPGGPGLPPVWVTAGLIIVALVALLVAGRRVLVLSGWAVAVLGLLVAIPVSRLSIRPAAGGAAVIAWPGVALAITAAGLLLAAAVGGDGLIAAAADRRSGGRRTAGGRGIAIVLLAVIGCSAPLAAGTFWIRHGVEGPVKAARGQIVPALVTDSAVGGAQVRTLILNPHGSGVSFQLLRGTGPNLGDAELAPVPAAESALRTAVAALAAPGGGQAVDQVQALARFDIGFVLMRAPVNQNLARTLDAVTGLVQVSMTPTFDLWRLANMPSRVSVLEQNGTLVPVPSGQIDVSGAKAPAAGGTLLLAEPVGGWQATLNGHPLTSVPSPAGSWAQAFRLPSGGGTLDIGRSDFSRDLALGLELLAALVVAALALPGSRSAAETAAAGESGAGAHAGAGTDAARRGRAKPDEDEVAAGAGARARAGASAGAGGYGGRGADADETMVGAAFDGAAGGRARGGEPAAGAGRSVDGGLDLAEGGRFDDDRFDDGRFDDGRFEDDELDDDRADGGRPGAAEDAGRNRGRGGKGRTRGLSLSGRGLGRRRGKPAGPDGPAQPGVRGPQPAGPGRLAAAAGMAAAGQAAGSRGGRDGRDDWDGGQAEDWDDSGTQNMPPALSPAGNSPSGRMGPPAGVRSPTGAWPYPGDDELDQDQDQAGRDRGGYGSGPYPVASPAAEDWPGAGTREAAYGRPAADWDSQPAEPDPPGRQGRRGSGQHASPGRRGSGDGGRPGRRGGSDEYAASGSRKDSGRRGRRGRSGDSDGPESRGRSGEYDVPVPRGGSGEYEYEVPVPRGGSGEYDAPEPGGRRDDYDGPGRRGGADEYAPTGQYANSGPYEGPERGGYGGPERRGGPGGYDGPERRGGSGDEYARPGAYAEAEPYADPDPRDSGSWRRGPGEYTRPARPGSRGGTGDYAAPGPRGGAGGSGRPDAARSGGRGQSSWPSGEDNGGWPTGQQPAVSGSDQAPSWSGGEPRPDRPAGATGSWRGGAQPPPAQPPPAQPRRHDRSAARPPGYESEPGYGSGPQYGADPAYNDPAYNDPAYDGEADWSGSDDALEPLPSTQTHRGPGGASGPQERSRRRWRAPADDEDPDERNAW